MNKPENCDMNDAPPDWQSPIWNSAGRVHEWKNYISERVKELWDSFTVDQKLAIAAQANEQARREEWE